MVNRISVRTVVLGIALVLVPLVLAGQEAPADTQKFKRCYLVRGDDGYLWLRQPMVVFGMWGSEADAPVYRLSDELAKRFEPVLTPVADTATGRAFLVGGLPRLRPEGDAVTLLDLQTELRPARSAPAVSPAVYEIVSARVTFAEFLPRDWLDAWRELMNACGPGAPTIFAAPDVNLAKRLREQEPRIRRSFEVLDSVARQWRHGGGSKHEHRAALNRVQFEAGIVRVFQHRLESNLRKALSGAGINVPEENADSAGVREQSFGPCYLYRGAQGDLHVCHPMIYLGMWGVMMPPEYRFDSELAARLSPLATEIGEADAPRSFYAGSLPRPTNGENRLILLDFEAATRVAEGKGVPGDSSRPVCEIVSANITQAEFVSRRWHDAWQTLAAVLDKTVEISRTPPTDDKRGRLAEQIEKGAEALQTMRDARIDPGARTRVQTVEPAARIVTATQDRITEQWGRELARYADRLKILPATPIPDFAEPAAASDCDPTRLLAESESAGAFMSRVRQTCSTERIERYLIPSKKVRSIRIWEFESIPAPIFETVRSEARQRLEQEAAKQHKPLDTLQDQWGVVLKPARQDLLRRKLALRGTVVEQVADSRSTTGLQAGDLIIDYDRVYDLYTAGDNWHWPLQRLAAIARRGGRLTVLRGDRLIELQVPRGE